MSVGMAVWVVGLAQLYAAVGLIVGLAFLLRGIDRVDPAARGAHAFRPLILPGLVLLWPVVAWRWARLAR
ncbi:hypothetical protein G3576_10010 [Roseomonas stagni]|uniref:Uncharacterized protein n=1 Tax=Falsiroseomonas algicola TaxID=2716930 RepID=A0A6M1LJ41_9PROT|nr:hypothetical protein [Falsiroseomonas algicola]NGM20348.1 hypothetical protein [Falsiroseomonas algicola]